MLMHLLGSVSKRTSVIELFLDLWEAREKSYGNPGSHLGQGFQALSPVYTDIRQGSAILSLII